MSAPMSARWQRWTIAAVAAFLIAGVVVVGHQSSRARRSADFTINYSAALLIRQGHPDAIYQRDQLGPLMLRLSDETIDPRLPFDAPLALALPWVPLTFLSLELAFRVWQLVTVCLLVSAMLLLGLKPQYLPAYLVLIAAQRQWRTLAAALLAAVTVGLSPLLAGGVNGLYAMVFSALEAGQGVARYNESLIGTISPFLPGRLPTLLGFSLWALALAALAVATFRRDRTHAIALGVLATVVAVLFSPHALPYDTVLLAVPAWLSFVLHRMGAIPSPAPAWLAVAVALVLDLGSPLVSLAPVVLLGCLVWYGRAYLQRAHRRPSAIAA